MNLLDILALIIIGVSILTASMKGLVVELLSLGSTILGLILAVLFYSEVANLFESLQLHPLLSDFIGFIIIFVSCILLGTFHSSLINRTLKLMHLKWVDRLLGGAFGFLRGYLICLVIFLAFTAFPINKTVLTGSQFRDYFLFGTDLLVNLAPKDFKERFADGWQGLYDEWVEPVEDTDRM